MKRGQHFISVALVAAAVIGTTSQLGNDYYLRIIFMMCVYYLCAAGMNVLVGYAGQKSLGQAGLFAAGAYAVALLTTKTDMSPWLALVAAAVISGVCGVLIALPSLRVKGPYLAMVTLAFGIVVEKLVGEWTEVFGGAQGIYGIRPITWNGQALSTQQWVWFGVVLCALTHLLLRNLLQGRFGRALLSLQADEIASSSVGVRVYRAKVIAFVVAAVTCGIAGALVAQQNQYINSDFITFHLSIFILLLVLFGGAGSKYGPLVGTIILTSIDAALARWPSAQHFLYGFLLLFALYVMPGGVMGVLNSVFKRKEKIEPMKAATQPKTTRIGPAASGDLLEVEGVTKAYGGVKPAQNVSFRLKRGHIHALIGPNGAGKSTMINMLTGVGKPTSGSIKFLGEEISDTPAHQICRMGMGRTFQNLRLFSDLSVLDNVMLGRHTRMNNGFFASLTALPGATKQEVITRERALQLLELVDLAHLAHQPAGSLPYGLQRRAELARALATEPQLLLLDEPAAGLNPQETAELGQLLLRIGKCGVSILMVEHHMDLVMSVSDHVIVLDYGIKIAEGKPAEVQGNPRVVEAYLGVDDENEATEEALVAALRRQDMLKLDSVKVSYGAIEAVKGVSLEVRKGEVVTIIGANGAGKSTLLKSIVGLEPVKAGKIFIDGKDCTYVPSHKRVGLGVAMSPEGRGVFADQTVRENLMLGAYSRKSDPRATEEAIEREFKRFPRLKERQHQLSGTLSGGEQQMLAIARALMSEPRLLLLDEPSLGLAPLIIKDIFEAIRQLRHSGLTILLVEQMAKQALGVADRAYVLETGLITLEGSGKELLNDPKVKAAYLGAH